jgi:hypothetical protein
MATHDDEPPNMLQRPSPKEEMLSPIAFNINFCECNGRCAAPASTFSMFSNFFHSAHYMPFTKGESNLCTKTLVN